MSLLMKTVTALVGAFVLFTPLFLGMSNKKADCLGLEITIADSSKHRFVTENDILNAVRSTGIKISGKKLNEIPLALVEEKVKSFRELKTAEVWYSNDRKVHIWCDQREPVIRVVASYGGDFFIDREGVIMRRHNLYTPHLQILEADMIFNPAQMTGMNIYESDKTADLVEAMELIRYIRNDSFWNSMIDYLSMSRDGRITMVPRIGRHVIKLGKPENYEEKLDNLLVFYREAMPKAGWDTYKAINLEYKGQIVCQRR